MQAKFEQLLRCHRASDMIGRRPRKEIFSKIFAERYYQLASIAWLIIICIKNKKILTVKRNKRIRCISITRLYCSLFIYLYIKPLDDLRLSMNLII